MSESPTPKKIDVRSIISLFENHSYSTENEPNNLIRRSKSTSSITNKPIYQIKKQKEPENNLELSQIDQEIQHLQKNCSKNYKSYSRENHIYYQNQIVFLLTDLANIEGKTATMINKKSELSEILKRLNKKLNSLLPSGGNSITKTPKFIQPIKPIEEKQIIIKEPIQTVINEVVDETDTPVSVRNLKLMFERNSSQENEKSEFPTTKISRKFLTFNSNSDFKYIPYSQKFKSHLGVEVNGYEADEKLDELNPEETLESDGEDTVKEDSDHNENP